MFDFVPNDHVMADHEGFAVDRSRVFFRRVLKLIHKFCVARLGFLTQKTSHDGAIRMVSSACGAQAAKKPDFDLPPKKWTPT
jgi:hypothetical protein